LERKEGKHENVICPENQFSLKEIRAGVDE
jgi:hypothetical protein